MEAHKVLPFYRNLCARIGIESNAGDNIGRSADALVPHPLLRRTLQNDPAMDAVLAGGGIHYALGSFEGAPFIFLEPGLIQLSSALIFDPAALSAAARWGLEAHHVRRSSEIGKRQLVGLARYGKALIEGLGESSRKCLLAVIPPQVRAELLDEHSFERAGHELLSWIAGVMGADSKSEWPAPDYGDIELDYPMERILARGGDSRLAIDPRTGCNRYGVPPRPRPEAIHFSSSTASAVTDYGFFLCDLLRRDLLASLCQGKAAERELRSRMVNAIGREILDLFGLDEDVSDVAITPSGTDAELLAVLVALSGAQGRPLVNVLIAPDESGSGVRSAASGCWFNDVDAAGVQIARGTAAWPDADIAVREIPIRDGRGSSLATGTVNSNFLEICRAALAEGNHLLVHVLMSSKTDLYAPDFDAVAELVAHAPERIDVVVDACQLRADFKVLGDLVREGWMVQVSGSKFLTGPPFSGALILPASLRPRAPGIVEGLVQSPAIGGLADWLADWTSLLPDSVGARSYGPLFRWLPALIEAKLFLQLPEDFRLGIASRFREALLEHMSSSQYLRPLNIVEPPTTERSKVIAQHSILSFVVLGRRRNGELTALNETECKRLFELLNRDVASLLQPLAPGEEALARQPVHIGQPVKLGASDTAITVLRLVLGARFFTIVGHTDPESRAAALESEIADAKRAIAKVELLSSYWSRLS
jgi:hypothetical protein